MKVIMIINIGFIVYSVVLYIRALYYAVHIEYKIREDALIKQLYDDKILFRIAMRTKLWLLLILTLLILMWYGGNGVQVCTLTSGYAMVVSLFFSVAWFLLALLMFLIYSRSDFSIFKLTKKE